MEQYNITGMSCAACSARIEKAVSKVDGVSVCTVNLLTNSMNVEGRASSEEIIKAVTDAGYGAKLKNSATANGKKNNSQKGGDLEDSVTPKLVKRLIWSIVFLCILMYFSMGHMMLGFPIPKVLMGNHIAMGLIQLLLTTIIMVINQHFFISGFKGLIKGAPNMDTLVALGSSAAYGWSVVVLFLMSDALVKGDVDRVNSLMHEFYFESAGTILTLITVGKMLEARSKGKTTNAIKGLMDLSPKSATVIRNGNEITIPIEQVNIGDIFVVKPGESIPVDGVIVEGESAVDESALTGESIPVDKGISDLVSAATINQSGYLKCEAKRVGEDTTLSQIIKMVSDASATKAPIAKIADKVSGVFVPIVITIAIITMLVWYAITRDIGYSLARGISVLVISCPCALGLATPVAIMVGNGVGAKNGILFKNAVALEQTGTAKVVVLDKTGTITKGKPVVTDIVYVSDKKKLLELAVSIEKKSEHPLATAIVKLKEQYDINELEVEDFSALPGNGLKGRINKLNIVAGSLSYIDKTVGVPEKIKKEASRLSDEGKTPLLFACDKSVLGMIAVADVIKEESPNAINELQQMGIKVIMLTGDNERTANAIGKIAGVDQVISGVLPNDKEKVISDIRNDSPVIMVGDGINDAPALTSATIGMAIGAGSDIAIDAADIVLMKNSLLDVAAAIRLSKKTIKNIKENLFWAFIYNVIGIPLAAGIFVPFGLTLNPMFGALAMSLSSFFVVSNALRLNLCKLYLEEGISSKVNNMDDNAINGSNVSGIINISELLIDNNENKNISKEKENVVMKKELTIEGMMCGHCENHVKKALLGVDGVTEAFVSFEEGNAVVEMTKEIANDVLKSVVEEEGYKVISIA